MPQQRRILCSMCVNNGRGLWVLLGSRTLDGNQVLETSRARPQSSPPGPLGSKSPTPLHRNRPHGRELVGVLFLTSTLGGTPELVMRKFQECWAFPVFRAGPGTSKVAFAAGWALQNAGSLVFSPHPCSRQPNIRPLHDRGLCEAHTASPWKASDTLTVWNSWLSWAEVGACVGVVGMVMVNSTQRVFRMFP